MRAHGVEDILRGLTGSTPLEEFNDHVRERQLAHFESAIASRLLDDVFSLARLENLLRDDPRVAAFIDVYDGTQLRQLGERQQSIFDAVSVCLSRGATIRLRGVEKLDPAFGDLAAAIERHFVGRCSGNVYLTPPGKAGFPPHFDGTDVFVVQCLGRKHWRIYEHYANKAELPLADTRWEPGRFEPSSPPRHFALAPGDVLYLPRGVMHEAFCTDRESMHLTISLASLTFADLLQKAIGSAAAADVELRRRVPWSATDDGERERLAGLAKDRLLRIALDSDLSGLLRAEQPQPRKVLRDERTD
jgi:hypothetical protein